MPDYLGQGGCTGLKPQSQPTSAKVPTYEQSGLNTTS